MLRLPPPPLPHHPSGFSPLLASGSPRSRSLHHPYSSDASVVIGSSMIDYRRRAAMSDPFCFSSSSAMSTHLRAVWLLAVCKKSRRSLSIRQSSLNWDWRLEIRHSPGWKSYLRAVLWQIRAIKGQAIPSRAHPSSLSRACTSRMSRAFPSRAEPVRATASSHPILHWDPGAVTTANCGRQQLGVAEPFGIEPIKVDEGVDPFVRHKE